MAGSTTKKPSPTNSINVRPSSTEAPKVSKTEEKPTTVEIKSVADLLTKIGRAHV